MSSVKLVRRADCSLLLASVARVQKCERKLARDVEVAGYGISRCPSVRQALWCGYAAVVGGIVIVAVWTTYRGRSVIAGTVISTRGGSADHSGADSGSTDRHSRAHTTIVATTVNATAIDCAAAVDTNARAICRRLS